jgi:hypothetical protein
MTKCARAVLPAVDGGNGGARSGGRAAQDADTRELAAEIDAIEKKDEPTEAESERLMKLHEQREAMEATESSDISGAKTLSEMETRIRAFPPIAAGLDRAGISAREYAKFTLAMVQAAMAAGFRKSGLTKELPAGIAAENVTFFETHEAELKAMQEEFERLAKGP